MTPAGELPALTGAVDYTDGRFGDATFMKLSKTNYLNDDAL